MVTVNPNKAGLVLGTLMGGWHLLWALLVAIGWAQPVIDFILRIHFIKPIYVIDAFNAGVALLLVTVTSLIGYALGFMFGVLWNKLHS